MREHRVPMLGAALRRHVDPARSRDPKVRELVAALATLEVAPPPREDFRAELRAQLVAVTPRLVAEGEASHARDTATTGRTSPAPERSHGFRIAKPLIAVACALTAFVLLLGGAVLISRNALPGDALYGVKRASEATEYGLTGGTVDKGKLKLEFAARRIGEVGALLPKASAMAAGTGAVADSGAINAGTASLVRDTLGSADSDVRSASQLLNTYAVRNRNAGALTAITSWTPGQITAMRQIVARIPAGSLHQRALATLQLIGQAQHRSSALRAQLGCSCLDPARADTLGPQPCTTPCSSKAPGTPGPSTSNQPGATSVPSLPGTTTRTPAPGTHPSASAPPGKPGSRPTGSGPNGHASTTPITTPTAPTVPGLPSLPGLGGITSGSSSTKLPISVDSCGLSASIGPIGIGVGGC